MKGKLIIFSAPSGSGKTTIVKHLLGKGYNFGFSVSATSRPARGNEVHGKDYYFLTAEDFRARIERNEFLEWEEVYPGKYYGTLKSEVERIRNNGNHVVFDVDVVGGCNIKEFYGNEALSVFIQPLSIEELEKRLKLRSTDSDEVIAERVAKAAYEMTFAKLFDVIIVNDVLEEAFKKAEEVIEHFIQQP
jgi:guanylate kinase